MAIEVRPLDAGSPSEVDSFLRTNALAMGRSGGAAVQPGTPLPPTAEPDRCLVGVDGDQIVATAQSLTFTMSVPGGRTDVPCAGVRGIAVLPTHRRRGVLRSLMSRQLPDLHERGDVLACLWSTEAAIYPRFGYGVGTFGHRVNVGRPAPHVAVRAGTDLRLRLLDDVDPGKAVATATPVYERLRAITPGMVSRSAAWWSTRWAEPAVLVTAENASGDVDGYCRYSTTASWCELGPANELHVDEVIACTPAARAALWRYLFEVDLVAHWSSWHSAPHDALPLLVDDIRSLRLTVVDGEWLRIVDLPRAIAARTYAGDDLDVVVHVRDTTCAWNDGVWRFTPGGASPSTQQPQLALDVADLASVYLGASTVADLARAGRVEELRAGAVVHTDAAFRSPTPPWAVTWF